MQFPIEPLGEFQLLLAGKLLIAEHEDGILVHPRPDLGESHLVIYFPKVYFAHLSGKVRMNLAKR
jgi:hypothetical protein